MTLKCVLLGFALGLILTGLSVAWLVIGLFGALFAAALALRGMGEI